MTDGMPELRPYQHKSVIEFIGAWNRGRKKVVLALPTGAGKTVVAAWMASYYSRFETSGRFLFVVDRIVLAEQAKAVFERYGLRCGVLRSSATKDVDARFLVATSQTMRARPDIAKPESFEIVFVDECHVMPERLAEWLAAYEGHALGLTATPYADGMASVWDALASPITTKKLTEDGFLVPLQVFVTDTQVNMDGARKYSGEWTNAETERRAIPLSGDVVREWAERCESLFGRLPPTLVFAATVKHAAAMQQAFAEAGHAFAVYTGRTKNRERAEALEGLRNGSVLGLISVEALARGFDEPLAEVLVSLRPYSASFSSHVQQLGRVMRPAPGKEKAVVMDFAGNWKRFSPDWIEHRDSGPQELREKRIAAAKGAAPEKHCPKCGLVQSASRSSCSGCGNEFSEPVVEKNTGPLREWEEPQSGVARTCVGDYKIVRSKHGKVKREFAARVFLDAYRKAPGAGRDHITPLEELCKAFGWKRGAALHWFRRIRDEENRRLISLEEQARSEWL